MSCRWHCGARKQNAPEKCSCTNTTVGSWATVLRVREHQDQQGGEASSGRQFYILTKNISSQRFGKILIRKGLITPSFNFSESFWTLSSNWCVFPAAVLAFSLGRWSPHKSVSFPIATGIMRGLWREALSLVNIFVGLYYDTPLCSPQDLR